MGTRRGGVGTEPRGPQHSELAAREPGRTVRVMGRQEKVSREQGGVTRVSAPDEARG